MNQVQVSGIIKEPQPQRHKIGNIMRDRLERVADFANDVRGELRDRLEPILSDSAPQVCSSKSIDCAPPQEVYPPYFEFMRDRIDKIENDLVAIKDIISRTEV